MNILMIIAKKPINFANNIRIDPNLFFSFNDTNSGKIIAINPETNGDQIIKSKICVLLIGLSKAFRNSINNDRKKTPYSENIRATIPYFVGFNIIFYHYNNYLFPLLTFLEGITSLFLIINMKFFMGVELWIFKLHLEHN